MAQMVIGAIVTAVFLWVVAFARRQGIQPRWWGWTLTVLGFLYAAFVLALVVAFLSEGAAQGALVMGVITGLVAVVWGVLLARFVFVKREAA